MTERPRSITPRMRIGAIVRAGAVCLFLGFTTTIALAWSLAAWMSVQGLHADDMYSGMLEVIEIRTPGLQRRGFALSVPGVDRMSFPAGLLYSNRFVDMGTGKVTEGFNSLPRPHAIQSDSTTWEGVQDARGWPFLCLWCDFRYSQYGPTGLTKVRALGGINLESMLPPYSDLSQARALPLRPLWWGLFIDTIVYSLLWAMSFALVPKWRRRLRRRRGHCPTCNYDLKGDLASGCPECGWNKSATINSSASAPESSQSQST